MKVKLHLHADEERFMKTLEENIDTLVGLNEEVFAEGLYYHEKKYKGFVRDDLFEITSKHIVGVLRTYNPWTIRGDFQSVGSNVELTLSLKRSKSLREVLLLFAIFPFCIVLLLCSGEKIDSSDFIVLVVSLLVLLMYHVSSRWIQFSTLRHFSKIISKTINVTIVPT